MAALHECEHGICILQADTAEKGMVKYFTEGSMHPNSSLADHAKDVLPIWQEIRKAGKKMREMKKPCKNCPYKKG